MTDTNLKATSTRNATRDGHHATLRGRNRVLAWQCKHDHANREEARACAVAELNRRQSTDADTEAAV